MFSNFLFGIPKLDVFPTKLYLFSVWNFFCHDRQTDSDLFNTDQLSIAEYCEKFLPEQYLQEYYSSDQMWVTDMILARESWDWLNALDRRFSTALDVGTGPVLEYPFLFAPFVDQYDLADYVENNLLAIRRWIDRSPDAHDWTPIFSGVLKSLGHSVHDLDTRTRILRDSIHALRQIDLRRAEPLGSQAQYDLVTSFFCTECVEVSIDRWERCKRRLLGLVAPGGAFFSAIVQNCTRYRILGSWFPTCSLNPTDLIRLLEAEGFTADVQSYECPEFADSGFHQFMVVKAIRV